MEVEPPTAPNGIQLVRASVNSLEILWTPVPNADHYILQLQKVEQQSQEEQSSLQ
jgi:host cell factor